jgi:hypothetical protein
MHLTILHLHDPFGSPALQTPKEKKQIDSLTRTLNGVLC